MARALDVFSPEAHNGCGTAGEKRIAAMIEFLRQPGPQIVLWGTAMLFVILLGYYVIGRFRPGGDDEEPGSSHLMTNFRELHARGVLSDEEYRTIRTKLAARMNQEIEGRLEGKNETTEESTEERQRRGA